MLGYPELGLELNPDNVTGPRNQKGEGVGYPWGSGLPMVSWLGLPFEWEPMPFALFLFMIARPFNFAPNMGRL